MALNSVGNLSAAGNAISEGLDAYLKAKQMKDQRAFQQQQLELGALEKGLIRDPNTPGGFLPSPATQGKLAYEAAQYDPSNPAAEQTRGLLKDQIRQVHPDYSDDQIEALAASGQSSKQYSDMISQMKPSIGGAYMVASRAPMAAAMNERNKITKDQGQQRIDQGATRLENTLGKTANDVNKQYNNDKIIMATDMQQNSISKGLQQLNSKDKPITNQMLNEIQNDYANALTGGRQAAQGTIHDQQMQTLQGKAANLKQYITGNPAEAATPEQVAYFKTAFNELRALNQEIRKSRVSTMAKGTSAAFGDNGRVGKVVANQVENSNGQGLIPTEPESVKKESPAGLVPNSIKSMSREDKIKLLKGG